MAQCDVAIIGAGIVGLATAYRLLERHPRLDVAVLEKEATVGSHQTGHNSGVVHRGVYYAPGSLKAQLCVEGARQLLAFCAAHDIPVRAVGKVIVARDESELPALDELYRRAVSNGVPGIVRIGRERLRELEPHAAGVHALHSPHTAVVDFSAVAAALADEIRAKGARILLNHEVAGLAGGDPTIVATSEGDLEARYVIACAGLQSDLIARHADPKAASRVRIVPFRGDYYVLKRERRDLVRGLLYPVPDPRFPFLGVHFTVRHDGAVWAGPNAVLAFRREGYRRFDVSVRELVDTLTYRGFWRVAGRYWRIGAAEMWRDFVKGAFVRALQQYVPAITGEDLVPGPAGVRAQAIGIDGSMIDDFLVDRIGRTLHVRNAPSPAATSSLAIGSLIVDRAERELGLAS